MYEQVISLLAARREGKKGKVKVKSKK